MITENLQDMVSGINTQTPIGTISEYDILLRYAKKESSTEQEIQIVEKSEPVTEVQNHYQPDEEMAMISYIKVHPVDAYLGVEKSGHTTP